MITRREVAVGTVVVVLALGALVSRQGDDSAAQPGGTPSPPTPVPSPTPPFSATFVAEAAIEALPAGDALLSVTAFTLPPGTTTKPFSNRGPILIRVQTGVVELAAEEAEVSPVLPPIGILTPLDPIPAPASGLAVPAGQQILLAAGNRAQIGNSGTQPATLMVVTLTYDEPSDQAPALASPVPSRPATPAA